MSAGTSYSKQEIIFIQRNWRIKSDKELSKGINRSVRGATFLRTKLGFIRPRRKEEPGSVSRDLDRGIEIRKLIKFMEQTKCPLLKEAAKIRIYILHEIIECNYRSATIFNK